MNKKTIIVTILILLGAFLSGWFIYQCWKPNNIPSGEASGSISSLNEDTSGSNNISAGTGYYRMINLLGFSKEQSVNFLQTEGQYRQKMTEYINRLDSIDLAIIREIQKEKPDKNQLDSLAYQSGKIQYALKKATYEHFIQIKNLCTPKQQERFMEVISEIGQYRRGQGRGEGRGNGKGKGWRNRNR
ncbi:hypothetical protein [Thermophagus xiamenensis]|uniref:Periplasmic heavy metal sensor n=1 Tax=Thermophagus xiamenensis TaxID=385682 RepID=A0A1I2CUX9_9BACT|nr:hypothetical protein [Thermophagus xiamenensis]SFE72111.1 hypothetical protein SAMN05444380_11717 [Thermophagus xiamenensis]